MRRKERGGARPVATEWRLSDVGCRLSCGRPRVPTRRMGTDATERVPLPLFLFFGKLVCTICEGVHTGRENYTASTKVGFSRPQLCFLNIFKLPFRIKLNQLDKRKLKSFIRGFFKKSHRLLAILITTLFHVPIG